MTWIYDVLVRDRKDIPGQFAYLYYKREKRGFAETLKRNGNSDEMIVAELRKYQDAVAADPKKIDEYKEHGAESLRGFLRAMQEETLAEAHRKFLHENKEIGQAIGDINKLVGQKRGMGQRFTSWLLIGVRSWLVTALIGILLFLLALALVSRGTQQGVFDEALDGIVRYIECQKSDAPPECGD